LVVAAPWSANSEPVRCGLPSGAGQFGAFGQRAAEHAREREPADRAAVRDLEHFGHGARAIEPLRGRFGRGRVVAQRLEQPAHAESVERRTEEDRHDQPVGGLALDVAEHRLQVGNLVGQQLLEQVVVVVGEVLEHAEVRRALGRLQVVRDRHLLGRLAGAVLVGAVEREVDEPGDVFAAGDRDLPRDQRWLAHRLQRLEHRLDRATRLVDLVDEDRVRHAARLELAQDRFGQRRALGLGSDHHQRKVGNPERRGGVAGEARRARRVEQHVAVAAPVESQQVELGRAAARPGFRAGVAERGSGLDRAQSVNGTGGVKQGLRQTSLAGAGGAYERDRPCAVTDGIHILPLGCLPSGSPKAIPARRIVRTAPEGKTVCLRTDRRSSCFRTPRVSSAFPLIRHSEPVSGSIRQLALIEPARRHACGGPATTRPGCAGTDGSTRAEKWIPRHVQDHEGWKGSAGYRVAPLPTVRWPLKAAGTRE
jgi:hypothetical protein